MAATAASIALPPERSMSSPASEAAGCDVHTMPCSPTASERPGLVKSRIAHWLRRNMRGGQRQPWADLVLEAIGADFRRQAAAADGKHDAFRRQQRCADRKDVGPAV